MCDFMFCPFLQLSFIARQSLKSCKMVTWSAKFPFNGLLRKVLTSSYVIETSKSSMFPVLGHLECLGLELLTAGILETNRAVSRISGIDSQAVWVNIERMEIRLRENMIIDCVTGGMFVLEEYQLIILLMHHQPALTHYQLTDKTTLDWPFHE